MSFFDKIKQQATDVASTVVVKTQDTAKTGQLQMQLRSLKSEEKDALADLGAAMMALGDTPDSLADQVAHVAETREKIAAKEQEIAERRESEEPAADAAAQSADTVESDAEEVAEAPPEAPAAAAQEGDTPS